MTKDKGYDPYNHTGEKVYEALHGKSKMQFNHAAFPEYDRTNPRSEMQALLALLEEAVEKENIAQRLKKPRPPKKGR